MRTSAASFLDKLWVDFLRGPEWQGDIYGNPSLRSIADLELMFAVVKLRQRFDGGSQPETSTRGFIPAWGQADAIVLHLQQKFAVFSISMNFDDSAIRL